MILVSCNLTIAEIIQNPTHTGPEWKDYFTFKVLPIFEQTVQESIKAYKIAASPRSSIQAPADIAHISQEDRGGNVIRRPSTLRLSQSVSGSPLVSPSPSHAPKTARIMEEPTGVKEMQKSPNGSEDATLVEIIEPKQANSAFKSKESSRKTQPDNLEHDGPRRKRQRSIKPKTDSREIPETPRSNHSALMLQLPTRSPNLSSGRSQQNHLQNPSQIQGRTSSTVPPTNPETQDVFWDATQQGPDFDLPPPPGGWEVEDEDNSNSNAYDDGFETAPIGLEEVEEGEDAVSTTRDQPPTASPPPTSHGQDTQGLFITDTQPIDTSLAAPPEGWSDSDSDLDSSESKSKSNSNPNPNPNPPNPPTTSTEILTLESWIEAQTQHTKHPAPESLVLEALKRTTLSLPLASLVLADLQKGKDVPDGVKGVWTEADDRGLEGADGRIILALERKHGSQAVNERVRFLRDWRL
jgi:hypothetical protein